MRDHAVLGAATIRTWQRLTVLWRNGNVVTYERAELHPAGGLLIWIDEDRWSFNPWQYIQRVTNVPEEPE